MVLGGGGGFLPKISVILFLVLGGGGWGLVGVMLKFSFMLSGPGAPEFLPTRLSQFTLSDRVFCYKRLLLILCVTFADYDDV